MKTNYFKTWCNILIAVLLVLFYQQTKASAAHLQTQRTGTGDTTRFQKPGRLKRAKKIKKDEDENEDGVSDDIRARAHQEFLQQRDPKLNRVPLERLLTARQKRDQFLNDVKVRTKNTRPQGNIAKPLGNSQTSAPSAPPTISGLQWHERGPNNVGGRTRALIFDMGDAANGYKRVFAGGVGGGLWVTSDITATPVQWTKINDFFDNIAISCIAQNPANPKEIYAGTGEGFLNADAIQGLGVWKSSDGGATWAQLPGTEGFKYINAILVDKNGSVYVAGESDIFVGFGVDQSTDGGSTWTNVISSSEAGADLQMAANGDVYASSGVISLSGHIYISDYTINGAHTGNAGTWTNITPASNGVITPATTGWNRIKLATAPSDANIVYAFFEVDYYSSGGKTNLAAVQQYNKSTNTWTVKTVPTEAFSNGQAWYSIAGAVNPNNSSMIYAGSLDAERSNDGGSTWKQYTHWNADPSASYYVHADHHAYVYAPGSSTRLIMGTDGGVFYSTNANAPTPTFVNKNNGYDVTQFYSVALHPTNFNYALAGAQDNGSEKLQGAGIGSSTTATGGDGADVFIDQTNGNIQITSYVYDNYYVSTDNGVTFNGLSAYQNGQFINPTDYDPSTKSLYAGSASGYYYRAENILSPAYNEVSVSGFNSGNVTAVAVSPLTANRVYFGLDNGNVVLVDNAQTGTSLTGVVLQPNGGNAATVSCVNVDPTNEDHILVTYSNYGVTHIIETKNASAATPTWTDVSGNLPDMPVRWSLFYPGDPTKAIIATELGVWTTDLINGSSTTWDPTNTGLANVEVDMLKYRAADRTLAAATHGRGVFTSTLPSPDATLASLTTSSGKLAPAFSSGTVAYTDTLARTAVTTVSSISITPTTTDPAATITVNGTTVASGTASAPLAMALGQNTVNIVVTAADGSTTKTYVITVTRLPSANNGLSSLSISAGTLTPKYSNAQEVYTVSVNNATATLTVTATTSDPNETLTINGAAATSGTASPPLPLAEGATTALTVVAKAQNGNKRTIQINVTRAASSDAGLSSLALSPGVLSPAFATGTTSYTANVNNSSTVVTLTPTTDDANATVTVDGTPIASGAAVTVPLNVGPNVITTAVSAQDGSTTQTYTVTVTRALSNNANLSTLGQSTGGLKPPFSSTTTSYAVNVSNATATMTLTPVSGDAGASIKVNGTAVTSGTATAPIALAEGAQTVITTIVTAQNGITTKTYTLTVTRAPSANGFLSSLKPSNGTLSPTFGPDDGNYTVSLANSVATITITPTAADANATIKVNGTIVSSGTASNQIPLAEGGQTVITTVVTSQNGIITSTYVITVTRAPSANANLATLGQSIGGLIPSFTTGTTSYTDNVSNATASMTLKPVSSDAHATIKVNGATVTSGTMTAPVALAVGPNTITTMVTAQNGTTTKTYILTVTRAAGGADSYTPGISVTKPSEAAAMVDDGILVHQGVSPNGDGVNDFLQIENITKYPHNTLLIMNRDGQLVFEAKGYDNSSKVFDGHSDKNGQMQLPGTYFYQLDYTVNGIAKHKTGFIVLKY